MCPPREDGLSLGVVIGKVALGHTDGQATLEVAPVLVRERVTPILKVSGHVHFVKVARGDERRSARETLGEYVQFRVLGKLRRLNCGVARVRHPMHLIKAVREKVILVAQALHEHAKELGGQLSLGNVVQVIEACEGSPAQIHGGEDVFLRPVDDLAELIPVVYLLEGQLFYGRTRDDHAVVVFALEAVEGVVELNKVVLGYVGGLMGRDAHEVAIYLQGRL